MTMPLYVFDMDDTLINGDCAMIWHEFLVERGIVEDANFIHEDRRLMNLYAQGELDMADYLQFCIPPIQHLTIDHIHQLAEQCVVEKILPLYFCEAQRLIQTLNEQSYPLLIISASVTFLVKAVAKHLGIEHAIGIDLVEAKNHFTPQILGVASYQQGKVTRLQQWQKHQPQTFDTIHFYTDSINDLPLCEYAHFSYLVNPCSRLKAQAQHHDWQILHWGK